MFDERGDLWNMVDKRVNTLVRPVPAAGGRLVLHPLAGLLFMFSLAGVTIVH